MQEKLKLK